MEWLRENSASIILMLFGAGGIGYAILSRILDKKKYDQEVRLSEATADIKEEDFWKVRYDILKEENGSKDAWWKDRYNTLYQEFQEERLLNNEIVKKFRTELNEIKNDYNYQINEQRARYEKMMTEYREISEESYRKELEYKKRISTLENLVSQYESNIKSNE